MINDVEFLRNGLKKDLCVSCDYDKFRSFLDSKFFVVFFFFSTEYFTASKPFGKRSVEMRGSMSMKVE